MRDLARKHDLWIIADEIYGRFLHDASLGIDARAPSFHDIAEDDEKILYVQTLSKNWAMTGWRIGWIEAPAALAQTIENLGAIFYLRRAGLRAARGDRGAEPGRGFRRASDRAGAKRASHRA